MMIITSSLQCIFAESPSLPQVVRRTMTAYFERSVHTNNDIAAGLIPTFPVSVPFQKPAGVFVTLSLNGKPRACWGSIYPQYANILQSTIYATLGALTKEYRYPPIRGDEWRRLKPQVTLVKGLEPIDSFHQLNPLRDGLMLRAGGRSGVILPGEASDPYYQVVMARLKAGVSPHASYQLYRIIADVYE